MGPLVRDRVVEIQKIVVHSEGKGYTVQFGHISSQLNPADCATRGLDKTLLKDRFWWKGPSFLSQPKETRKSLYNPVTLQICQNEEDEFLNSCELIAGRTASDAQLLSHKNDIYEDLLQNIRFPTFPTSNELWLTSHAS